MISCLAVFFETLDASVLNMAIPSMEQYFNFGPDAIQWVQALYLLFYGGFVLLGGRLTDIRGRRNVYITGAAIFGAASFAAGFAKSFGWLLACRAVQGIGVAFAIPAAIAIIIHTFTVPQERNRAMGIFGAMAGTGFATGLAIGGLISAYWGWQWVFFINVPVIILAILLALTYIPADQKNEQSVPSDYKSGLMITTLMLAAAWMVHSLGSIGSHPWMFAGTLTGFLVLGTYFIQRERAHATPLVDFSIFRLDGAVAGNLAALLTGAAFVSYLFLLTLYLQQHLLFSPASAGLLLLPFSILSGLFSKFILPFCFKRLGVTGVGLLGNAFMVTGFLSFMLSYSGVLPVPLIVFGIFCTNSVGISMIFPSVTILSVQAAPPHQQGLASGINGTSNSFGGGLGLSVTGLIMQVVPLYQLDMHLSSLVMLLVFEALAITTLLVYQRKHSALVEGK
ncbi:Major Facilitator Superfamily protein [Chitinophaga jiangningensis]|uniref:Major Facilitator Superfamily protein n=2 Tax=Chitinophaga jiangningensis TaxID=1419482 RepID=A0A1M6VWQ3_9BACT|nr:Major Facilitator Superfamily protein [Chitinophaga jiangningensis]